MGVAVERPEPLAANLLVFRADDRTGPGTIRPND